MGAQERRFRPRPLAEAERAFERCRISLTEILTARAVQRWVEDHPEKGGWIPEGEVKRLADKAAWQARKRRKVA